MLGNHFRDYPNCLVQTLPRVLTRHRFIPVGATVVYLATWGTFLGRTVGVRGFGDKGIVIAGSGPGATQKGLCTAQFCFKMPYLNGYAGKSILYSTSICMFFFCHEYIPVICRKYIVYTFFVVYCCSYLPKKTTSL